MTPTLRQLIEGATPGPWVVAPASLTPMEVAAPMRLAVQHPEKHPDVCRFLDGVKYSEANARLIARLNPEVALAVLEALEGAKAHILDHGNDKEMAPVIEALDRALSRLNGQAQPSPAP